VNIHRDTVTRFSDRADDYVRYRPSYPAEAIAAILDGLGPPSGLEAADVGAGTGISARLLADRGVHVSAIEPGDAMRRAAAPHPGVEWMAGTADATTLASQSMDLVLCAQSFHWFHPPSALAEFARVLKDRGRLELMWNRRSKVDPFTAGYREAIFAVGGESGPEQMVFDPGVLEASGVFAVPRRVGFPNLQRLDLDGLIGRARSASYVPKTGTEGDRLLELLRGLHRQYADSDGFVTIVYETELFLTHKL
jgi:SAM-dependent methyltransferase